MPYDNKRTRTSTQAKRNVRGYAASRRQATLHACKAALRTQETKLMTKSHDLGYEHMSCVRRFYGLLCEDAEPSV